MTKRRTSLERRISDIKEAKGLLSLVRALRHAESFLREKGERLSDHIDLTSLPAFGEGPSNTLGVYSWETFNNSLFLLVPSDEPRLDGWEVIKA